MYTQNVASSSDKAASIDILCINDRMEGVTCRAESTGNYHPTLHLPSALWSVLASFSLLFLIHGPETLLIWSPSLLLWQKDDVNWSVLAQSQKNWYFDKQRKVQTVHFIQIISFPNPNQAVLCWNLTKPQKPDARCFLLELVESLTGLNRNRILGLCLLGGNKT